CSPDRGRARRAPFLSRFRLDGAKRVGLLVCDATGTAVAVSRTRVVRQGNPGAGPLLQRVDCRRRTDRPALAGIRQTARRYHFTTSVPDVAADTRSAADARR